MRFVQNPHIRGTFNPRAILPYGVTADEIRMTLEATYELLQAVNSNLVLKGHNRFEEMMLGNAFAGFLSEIVVTSLAKSAAQLTRNKKVGGYPDLIPKGKYPSDQVLRGEGLEVKASKQRGGWQGHNPERGWLIVFVYKIDTLTSPVEDRQPTEFTDIFAAELSLDDWSFSGRKGESRRTITASILAKGVTKLRSNWIYRLQPQTNLT